MPPGEAMFLDTSQGPVVVGPVADNELDLVVGRQVVQDGPPVLARHARRGGLEVHDLDDLPWYLVHRQGTAGLQHYLAAVSQQPLQQVDDLRLHEGLAAGDLHQAAAVRRHPLHYLIYRHILALVEGVLGVAPRAPQIAACQAHEDARPPGVGRLPLNTVEDFVYLQHVVRAEFRVLFPAGAGKKWQ